MRRSYSFIAVLLAIYLCASFRPAQAVLMTYTLTGTASGNFNNGTIFTNAPFTWVQTGDTSAQTTITAANYPVVPALTSTLQITGLPVIHPTAFYTLTSGANFPTNLVAFINGGVSGGMVFQDVALNFYNFLPIGPLNVGFWSVGTAFATAEGPMNFYASTELAPTSLVFNATAVPEPTTLALVGASLLGLVIVRRKRAGPVATSLGMFPVT